MSHWLCDKHLFSCKIEIFRIQWDIPWEKYCEDNETITIDLNHTNDNSIYYVYFIQTLTPLPPMHTHPHTPPTIPTPQVQFWCKSLGDETKSEFVPQNTFEN